MPVITFPPSSGLTFIDSQWGLADKEGCTTTPESQVQIPIQPWKLAERKGNGKLVFEQLPHFGNPFKDCCKCEVTG